MKPDSVDKTLQDKTSEKKDPLQCVSSSKSGRELSPEGQNSGEHHQNSRAHAEISPDAGISPAGGSVSAQTFPPYKSKKEMNQSGSHNGNSDIHKYATRVKICANGKEVISRVPCYSGNIVFPTVVRRGEKARCPLCDRLFVRIDTLRNHVVCVHNVIRSGETVYCCVPCKFETSYSYLFAAHQASSIHRLNLDRCKNPVDHEKPKRVCGSATNVHLAASCSLQQTSWFYSSVPSQSCRPNFGHIEMRSPRVVWHGHLNHLCSSECLSGLNTHTPSAADVTGQTVRRQKSLDSPAAKVPTASTSVDASTEPRQLRSSADACVQKKVTARKSTTQPLRVAFKFVDKKKETPVPHKEHSVSNTAKTSLPRPADNDASLPGEIVTIIDSDSDSEEAAAVKNTPVKTQPSNSSKKRTSSGVKKRRKSLTCKQKDRSSKKSVNTGGSIKVPTPKSSCETVSDGTEALVVSCSGSSSNTVVVSTVQQNTCKSATLTAAQVSVPVTTIRAVLWPVPESCSSSSNVLVNRPASLKYTVSAVTSSATPRSVPVIGVAKAVPAVTAVTHTTTTSSRSMYSLHRFSAETLWSELCRRGGMRSCDCGVSFMDSALYMLHRSSHSDLAPLKCAFCDHKAATSYDFHAHLLDHKK